MADVVDCWDVFPKIRNPSSPHPWRAGVVMCSGMNGTRTLNKMSISWIEWVGKVCVFVLIQQLYHFYLIKDDAIKPS